MKFVLLLSASLFLVLLLLILLSVLYVENASKSSDIELSIEIPFENLYPEEERYFSRDFMLPEDTFVVFIDPDLIGNNSVLHHANIIDAVGDNIYCPGESRVLYATGAELNTIDIRGSDYGIFAHKGPLEITVHLANEGSEIESGSFRFTLIGKEERKSATPVFLSIRDYCNSQTNLPNEYTIPGGISHHEAQMERTFVLPMDGALLGWGGHLHTYGNSLSLLLNEHIFLTLLPASNPREYVDNSSSVFLPPQLLFHSPKPLQRGDELDLRSVYDKPADLFYMGAMGEAYLLFDFE